MSDTVRLTRLEATLLLPERDELPTGYRVQRPPMPSRRRVSIEEFEADMRAAANGTAADKEATSDAT